jgi:hypothetical protein
MIWFNDLVMVDFNDLVLWWTLYNDLFLWWTLIIWFANANANARINSTK